MKHVKTAVPSSLPQLVESLDHEQHVESRAARVESAMLLREDTLSLSSGSVP